MISLQVKFSSTSVLVSVMYRPPDDNEFFNLFRYSIEKAWLQSLNIIVLGDFKCDFSMGDVLNISRNNEKLCSILDLLKCL